MKFYVLLILFFSSLIYPQENTSRIYDPCELLTIEDIQTFFPEATIKITTHDLKPANPLGMRRCFWEAGEEDMKFVQLAISSDAETRMKVADQFANNKEFMEHVEPVEGIGDESYYGGSGLKAGAGLHVLLRSKGVMLNITVGLGFGNADEQKHIEIEKSLAIKAIETIEKE
ncbi:MAG TPA: hypothetical protein ENO02_02950 [Epsilonproteobacteria bacterium]|nr:hypothetical protein [Campylobacterota bacterium]